MLKQANPREATTSVAMPQDDVGKTAREMEDAWANL
jgi:hypothetical protein